MHKLVSGPITLVLAFFLPLAVALCFQKVNVDTEEGGPSAAPASGGGKKEEKKVAPAVDKETVPAVRTPDYLLFLIPLANAAYFSTIYWRYPGKVKNDLYLGTAVVNAISVTAHAYGSGVISFDAVSRPDGLKMSGFFDKLALVCGNARATAEGSPTGFMAMTLQVLMVVYAWLRYVAVDDASTFDFGQTR